MYFSGTTGNVCGFSQRLQRPSFIRKTKHSGTGHEDIGYSYVVLRRGARPEIPQSKVGRIGEVGRLELENLKSKVDLIELQLHDDHEQESIHLSDDLASAKYDPILSSDNGVEDSDAAQKDNKEQLSQSLRQEAFHWPRLVFPPLKRSGHVVLDCCVPEGKSV